MTEQTRKLCEWLVQVLPLPADTSGVYFRLHCKLAGWAMNLGEPQGGNDNSGDLPF